MKTVNLFATTLFSPKNLMPMHAVAEIFLNQEIRPQKILTNRVVETFTVNKR